MRASVVMTKDRLMDYLIIAVVFGSAMALQLLLAQRLALSPYLILALIAVLMLVVIAISDLRLIMLLLVLVSGVITTSIYTISFWVFKPGFLLLVLLVAAWIFLSIWRGTPLIKTHLELPLIAFVIANIVALALSYIYWDPQVDLSHRSLIVQLAEVALMILPAFVALCAANIIKTQAWLKTVYFSMLGLTIVFLISGLVTLDKTQFWWTTGTKTWAYSGFIQAGPLLLLIFIPVSFSQVLFGSKGYQRLGYLLVLILGLTWAVLTPKVSFWSALITSMLIVSWFRSKKFFIFVVLTMILLSIGFYGYIEKFLAMATEFADFDRIAVWQDSLKIVAKQPIFGIGPGNYWSYMLRYGTKRYSGMPYGSAHNQYLGILVQTGIAGLSAFLLLLGGFIKTGLELIKQCKDLFIRPIAIGWLGSFIGLMVGCMFSDMLMPFVHNEGSSLINYTIYYWIFAGLMIGFYAQLKAKTETANGIADG